MDQGLKVIMKGIGVLVGVGFLVFAVTLVIAVVSGPTVADGERGVVIALISNLLIGLASIAFMVWLTNGPVSGGLRICVIVGYIILLVALLALMTPFIFIIFNR